MGDIIHTLPAVATLKHSYPGAHVAWVVDPRWLPLLAGNQFIDELIPCNRRKISEVRTLRKRLRAESFDTAFDFQGLIKSALIASMTRPERIYGFHHLQLREKFAGLIYSHRVLARSSHVVDRNIELAASAGASNKLIAFPIPAGVPEGELPQSDFVLASPIGGWKAKQWPLEYYVELSRMLASCGLPLVLNGMPSDVSLLASVPGATPHVSGIEGLIHATQRAVAVVGIDSGPTHVAAALKKPGVAIFGPTDPQRNGPYGGSLAVLRHPEAITTYKRRDEIDRSMRAITPEQVFLALREHMKTSVKSERCSA